MKHHKLLNRQKFLNFSMKSGAAAGIFPDLGAKQVVSIVNNSKPAIEARKRRIPKHNNLTAQYALKPIFCQE